MRGQSHPLKGKHLDPHTEAEQEIRESSVPGARGEEFHTREREGDEGQPFKRGGAMHHKRERGGYMPEETEASQKKRGQRGTENPHEAEPEADRKEGEESYKDEPSSAMRKRGGRMKRARGGHLKAEHEHKHALPEKGPHHPHHHPRKRGGKVPGHAAKERPDRRARGGKVTADLNPVTAAGNMSVPEYERQPDIPNGQKSFGTDTKGKNG